MRPQPMICVSDVEASSRFYQKLLNCLSGHGGREYERLVYNDQLIMQLHNFETDHHHGQVGNPNNKPFGNGVLLWFEIEDFDAAMKRIEELKPKIILPKHRNHPNPDWAPNQWEVWLNDPDGYTVVLASPQGTADGNWKP